MEFKTGGHNGILLALGAGDAVIGDVNELENRAPGAIPAPGKLLPNRPFVRAPRAAEPSPEHANPAPVPRDEPRPAPAAAIDFREKDLHGRSFEKTRLDGADFSGANLQDCKFGGASVRKAIFKDADVKGAWLTDADFTEADMREMRGDPLITGSHFDRANLQGLTIKVANCTFKGANLRDCVIVGYTYGCDFSGADLRGVNLRPAALADGPAANRWKGTRYDDDTAWPDGFDPVAAGAVLVKGDAK